MPEITLNCRIVTPAFVGGADSIGDQARRDPPTLRPSGIIGPLRYWFRALAGKECGGDPAAVYKMEEAVFGSRNRAAAVRVSIKNCRVEPEELRRPPLRLAYLGGQGLFQWNSERKEYEPTRRSFRPGGTFDLCLSGPPTQLAAAYASTLALLWFGGLGSRSRKGFGSLAASTAQVPNGLPSPDLPAAAKWPNAFSERIVQCMAAMQALAAQLRIPKVDFASAAVLPAFPSFAVYWNRWLECASADPIQTLHDIGKALRKFREDPATRLRFGNRLTKDYVRVVGEFMDERVVVGAVLLNDSLGLPVQYQSGSSSRRLSKACVTWRGTDGKDEADQRRASPVWISVSSSQGKGTLNVSFLLFGSEYLPDDAEEVVVNREQPWMVMDMDELLVTLQGSDDNLSRQIRDWLRPETRALLSKYNGPEKTPSEVLESLDRDVLTDLDSIASSRALYEAGRFEGVSISTRLRELAERRHSGNQLSSVNLRLLAAAYPQIWLSTQQVQTGDVKDLGNRLFGKGKDCLKLPNSWKTLAELKEGPW